MRFAIAFIIVMATAFVVVDCDISESPPPEFMGMEPVEVYNLQVPEPSGLTFNTDKTVLYTVSDPIDNKVYKLDLDGTVQDILSYHGDDLEGITYDDRDNTLWIVEEGLRQVVHLDTLGNEISRHQIDYDGFDNNGFEGICLLPDGRFYVLNEMNPGALLELDSELNLVNVTELDFAEDYSGICYVESANEILIISDMSKQLFVLDENLNVISTTDLEYDKIEGIDFNPENNRLYMVNDATTDLYVYQLEY